MNTPTFAPMLSDKELAFLKYWEENREKQKTNIRPLIIGLSAGLGIGASTLLLLSSNWYERATMEANAKANPTIFFIVIILIAFFLGFFYRNYIWERQEQQYLELIAKKKRWEKNAQPVQQ